jgi:TPR repeat protein
MVKILLLLFLMMMRGIVAVAADHAKSLALKDHSPQHAPFYLHPDRSGEELWNNFLLVKQANSGDVSAQHELGLRHLMGSGFSADTTVAAYWIGKAAAQNLVAAKYNFGILVNNGWGTTWNPYEAYKYFQYAARHGMKEAEYVYGLLLTDNLVVPRNYHEAYRWVKAASDSGYEPAGEVITEFGRMGITQRIRKEEPISGKHRKKSTGANPGSHSQQMVQPVYQEVASDSVSSPDDQLLLKEALSEGIQKEHNDSGGEDAHRLSDAADSSVIQSLETAADAGSPEALTFMGRSYEEGNGVDVDSNRAAVYFLRAVRLDSYWSSVLLWQLVHTPNFFHALKKHIDQKDPAAEFVWAGLIAFGYDNQLTESQALAFLQHAQEQHYTEATVELGLCYYAGKWVKEDRDRGIALLRSAAEAGSREANIRLAMIALMKTGNETPDSTLLHMLTASADAGSVLAQAMLGYCYQEGKGVQANVAQAVRCYRKAVQRGNKIAYNALRKIYDTLRPEGSEFQLKE